MKIQIKILVFLCITLPCIGYFTWESHENKKQIEETNFYLVHTNKVINQADLILSDISQLESNSHLFALNGDEKFAQGTQQALANLTSGFAGLRTLTAGDSVQSKSIDHLWQLTNEKIHLHLDDMENRRRSAEQAEQMPVSRRNELMDSIQLVVSDLRTDEQSRLNAQEMEMKRLKGQGLTMNIAKGMFYFILVFVLLNQLINYMRRRMKSGMNFASAARYRQLIDEAAVGMLNTDLSGNFTYINDKVEKLTGYTRNEILNKHLSLLVSPAYRHRLETRAMRQLLSCGLESSIEFPITTKTGEEKWVELHSVLSYGNGEINGFKCIVKDIHERKQAEAQLLHIQQEKGESGFMLQSILEHTPEIMYIKDLNGKYLKANNRFKETFGPKQDIIGKTDYELEEKDKADHYANADRKVIETLQPLEMDDMIVRHGKTHYLKLVKFPIFNLAGEIYGISCIATDITASVQYNEQLAETTKQEEKAEKLQEEFLANMSHEIRTPMNGILGMTNLLLQSELNKDQQYFVRIIKQSSDNLLFLINDILDLSKIRAGKMTIESIEFKVREVVETVLEPLKIKIIEKGLVLVTEIDPSIPARIIGDPYRLGQILTNLLGNAVKFTHKGSITLSVISVAGKDDCTLRFSVKDTGIGIPSNKIDYIFESFAQAGRETSRKYGGTGLGLSITRQLIDLQLGTMNVTSIEGMGSSFVFQIPYKKLPGSKVEDMIKEKSISNKENFSGKKILIVEDNTINQMVIAFTLKQVGIIADIANNGREAVELLEQEPCHIYDLIIMDLQMPELDGFETSMYIRNILHLKMPIIAMTASSLQDEREKCLKAGMNEYMTKPFAPADLFMNLNKLLIKKPENMITVNKLSSAGVPPQKYDLTYFKN